MAGAAYEIQFEYDPAYPTSPCFARVVRMSDGKRIGTACGATWSKAEADARLLVVADASAPIPPADIQVDDQGQDAS